MDTSSWTRLLTKAFPRLSGETFEIVAQPSDQYNCIAYAAGVTNEWWSHVENRYWPDHASRSDGIESLIDVFASLGFEQCQGSSLESDYEKVALYEVCRVRSLVLVTEIGVIMQPHQEVSRLPLRYPFLP